MNDNAPEAGYIEGMEDLAHSLGKINLFNFRMYMERYKDRIDELCAKNLKSEFKYDWYNAEGFNCSRGMFNRLSIEERNETRARVLYDIFLENNTFHEKRCFERYGEDQPLFKAYPELLKKVSGRGKSEYFHRSVFDRLELYAGEKDDVRFGPFYGVKYGSSYFEYPEKNKLIEYVEKVHGSDYFLHIDPYTIHDCRDVCGYIESAIIKPIDSRCISNFKLKKGYSGGEYDCSYPTPELYEFPDYKSTFNTRADVRLEAAIMHKGNDMELFLEELFYDNFLQKLTGRFVHCNIKDAYEKDLRAMNLEHLDFSVNVYRGDDIQKRWNNKLSERKDITEATYRTHFLMLEKVPFNEMIPCAYSFINRKCLALDWIYDQFGIDPSKLLNPN